jgi:hypothetical protein
MDLEMYQYNVVPPVHEEKGVAPRDWNFTTKINNNKGEAFFMQNFWPRPSLTRS